MPFIKQAQKKTINVVASLDVEEEGLFSGKYAVHNPPVQNIEHLRKLEPLLQYGIRPTLFCAYSVLANDSSRAIIKKFQAEEQCEIGTHLHHWNTPPIVDEDREFLNSVPAAEVRLSLLQEKLTLLQDAAKEFAAGSLRVFRMGRWDLHGRHWQILANVGIDVDASVRPWHCGSGPDHYFAPVEPYWVKTANGAKIFEIPLTVTPLSKMVAANLPKRLRSSLKQWGALTLLPVQHPLWLMQLTTMLHLHRGGSTLSLTWHSSEMTPGACPHLPDAASVAQFLDKLSRYLRWLNLNYDVNYLTAGELALKSGAQAPLIEPTPGDWSDNYSH